MAVRILGINGSIRAGSSAGRAMQFAFRALERTAAQCESFEIGSLPVLDGRSEDQYPASVSAWRAAAGAADGLLVVVPSFHSANVPQYARRIGARGYRYDARTAAHWRSGGDARRRDFAVGRALGRW